MPKQKLTYEIAMSAGKDAANRQMRKAGRKKWNKSDYNLFSRTANKLLDKMGYDK